MYAVDVAARSGQEAFSTLIRERQEQLSAQRQAGGGVGASETAKLKSVQGGSEAAEPSKTPSDEIRAKAEDAEKKRLQRERDLETLEDKKQFEAYAEMARQRLDERSGETYDKRV